MTLIASALVFQGLLPSYKVIETRTKDLSVYSDKHHGNLTSDGSVFYQHKMTVADKPLFEKYKRGKGYGQRRNRVYVRIELNGRYIFAELTDVTAKSFSHRTDLSRACAKALTGSDWGLWRNAKVEVVSWK